MRTVLLTLSLLTLLTLSSCFTTKSVREIGYEQEEELGRVTLKGGESARDSLEYQLLIFDPGFDYWLNTHLHKKEFYSNNYLQTMNRQYVMEWNRRYSSGDPLISSYIDYQATIDYPYELNFKLYFYFKYFEESHKVALLPTSKQRWKN